MAIVCTEEGISWHRLDSWSPVWLSYLSSLSPVLSGFITPITNVPSQPGTIFIVLVVQSRMAI